MAQVFEGKNIDGQCCDNKPGRMVTFDNGDGTEETLLVCDEHFQEECFSRCAKVVVVLK